MNIIGLDIGGANLKAANTDRVCVCRQFPLWKDPAGLAAALIDLIEPLGEPSAFAVTMTGELADCFATKADGVAAILQQVAHVAAGRPVHVWQTGAEFIAPDVACDIPRLVAAANWHALATWLGRMVPDGPAILLDIGSSTTDVIPLLDGRPTPVGMTDVERLLSGELLYTGARRSPLCALAHSVPLRGGTCPLAAEVFATTLDVHLLTGSVTEAVDDTDTANGQPATVAAAMDRLARMLCCDRTELSDAEIRDVADFLAGVQRQRITGSLNKVRVRLPEPGRLIPHLLISGSGSFLGEQVVADHSLLQRANVTRLSSLFDPSTAAAACAVAVAMLARERCL